MPALVQPPQQVAKAYSTNYTVPMELMKRDKSLPPLSPMHSPHLSPQLMRKAGGPMSHSSLGHEQGHWGKKRQKEKKEKKEKAIQGKN